MPDFTPVEGGDFYFVDAADAEEVFASCWRSCRSGSLSVLG